ncbi:protein required for normal CLN1 and CLN2 G1 cyclin expression [Dipsacomyces acuminosporus]|nr:protein required for normal CLN1 and CLN2 G1 cyclin expression [Dipsacomyces acuminosporus]
MATPSLEPRVIEVPIDNSNDVLEIDCSQLPEHAAEICDILENEGSALKFYQLFALEYYKQGHTEEAIVALKRGIANAKANDQTAKVPLLNLLASIYVQKAKKAFATSQLNGSASASTGDRDMLLQMASTLLTEAERINRGDSNTYLVKGMLAMTKRLPDAALQQFNVALKIEPDCLSSLLGKARVLFGKKLFQQALAIYQRILTLRPKGKPDVRIGIGMCLQKLGHVNDARAAFERAIEVNPEAAAPHILLATMNLNKVKRLIDPRINGGLVDSDALTPAMTEAGEYLNRAMKQLQRAYELQPDNAVTLIRLADRLFYTADYDGAKKLAERAFQAADTMAIQAEACYQVGRAQHAAKRFDLAYEAYQKCLTINDKHVLARYGLGQMQLQRTDMSSAEATFQRVVDRHPKCVEVLRALGFLHARLPNNKAKALEYYEKEMQVLADEAAEHAKRAKKPTDDVAGWFDDANLFLESGLLYEAVSAKKARKAYAMAADILSRDNASTSGGSIPELWNNLGVLSQLTGDEDELIFAEYDQAVNKCTKLLENARSKLNDSSKSGPSGAKVTSEIQRLESTLLTITYNVARFYEHCGFWDKAEALYKKTLSSIPSYVDARLRLAHIAFYYRGNAEDALAQISQAIGLDPKRQSAWLMRGYIELQRKNVQDARRAFEHVLKDIAKHDIHALCSLGNFYLAAGKSEQTRAQTESNPASAAAKKAKELSAQNYKRALEFFDKCLQLDEKCAPAAHGAAIAIAERGFANDARVIFQDVRDAATVGLGSPALCSPASDLVFKISKTTLTGLSSASSALSESAASATPFSDSPVGSDVLLWSGVNAAHAYVETENYRQAVLAYEASIRRLQETTKILEDVSTKDGTERLVIAGLEEPEKSSEDTEPADKAKPKKPVVATKMTKAERSERKRVERDLRLYLVRALYIQAKADKSADTMRLALQEIRNMCAALDIKLPDLPSAAASATEGEPKTSKDTDGDVEMKNMGDGGSTSTTTKKQQPPRTPSISPEDALILYDVALIEQAVAQLVSEQSESTRTLKDLETASTDLEHSTAAFAYLAEKAKSAQKKHQRILYSQRLATERAGYGKSLVTKMAKKTQEQEVFERERKEHAEKWRKKQEEEEKIKREQEDRIERERREREAKMLKEAEERNAILRQEMAAAAAIAASQQAAEAANTSGGSRSRKAKARSGASGNTQDDGFISDNDDLDDLFDSGEEPKKKTSNGTGGGGKDEELYPGARPISEMRDKRAALEKLKERRGKIRNRSAVGHSDDDDDDSGANTSTPNKRRHIAHTEKEGKYKSKAIITASDDEDEDDDDGDDVNEEGADSTEKKKSKSIIKDSDDESDH